jgi:16S rRNA G966 N2-methylase RsmD
LWLTPSRFCEIGDSKRPAAEMWCVDAQHLANQMSGFEVDVAYLDPPYNQHAYSSNYHVLNALTLWDQVDLPSPDTKASRVVLIEHGVKSVLALITLRSMPKMLMRSYLKRLMHVIF